MATDLIGIGKALEESEKITRECRELMLAFLKPGVTEAGEFLGELANRGRRRIFQCMTDAKKLVDLTDAEGKQVPEKILVPLLQACALEEDEGMAKKWSTLLASAATVGNVDPTYVDTL